MIHSLKSTPSSSVDQINEQDILAALGNMAPQCMSTDKTLAIPPNATTDTPSTNTHSTETASSSPCSSNFLHNTTSTDQSFHTCWGRIYQVVALKYTDFATLRILMCILSFFNILSIAIEAYCNFLALNGLYFSLYITVVAFVLTLLNTGIIYYLVVYPSALTAFGTLALIIMCIAFYSAQVALFVESFGGVDSNNMIVLVVIAVHIYSLLILYRYYESIMFNYNGNNNNGDRASSIFRFSSASARSTTVELSATYDIENRDSFQATQAGPKGQVMTIQRVRAELQQDDDQVKPSTSTYHESTDRTAITMIESPILGHHEGATKRHSSIKWFNPNSDDAIATTTTTTTATVATGTGAGSTPKEEVKSKE